MSAWDVLVNTIWSLFGFGAGYLFGRTTREMHEVREIVVGETKPRHPHARPHFDAVVGIIVLALAVASIIVASLALRQQQHVVDCQSRYNEAFASSIIKRNQAFVIDRENLYRLIAGAQTLNEQQGGLGPDATVDQYRQMQRDYDKLFRRFIQTKHDADTIRDNNPLPNYPPKC